MARLDRQLADACPPDALLGAIAEVAGRAVPVPARVARVTVVLTDGQQMAAAWPEQAETIVGRPVTIVDGEMSSARSA